MAKVPSSSSSSSSASGGCPTTVPPEHVLFLKRELHVSLSAAVATEVEKISTLLHNELADLKKEALLCGHGTSHCRHCHGEPHHHHHHHHHHNQMKRERSDGESEHRSRSPAGGEEDDQAPIARKPMRIATTGGIPHDTSAQPVRRSGRLLTGGTPAFSSAAHLGTTSEDEASHPGVSPRTPKSPMKPPRPALVIGPDAPKNLLTVEPAPPGEQPEELPNFAPPPSPLGTSRGVASEVGPDMSEDKSGASRFKHWDPRLRKSGTLQVFRQSMRTRLVKHARTEQKLQAVSAKRMYQNRETRMLGSEIVEGIEMTSGENDNEETWVELIRMFIQSDIFDYIVCFFLVVNAASIGASVEWKARHPTSNSPTEFQTAERIFCVLFAIELSLRIWVFKWKFFYDGTWMWNIFDFVLVGLQILEEFTMLAFNPDDTAASSKVIDAVKFIRFLRLLRIIRVVRLVRFVAELRKLMYLIFASFWSFIWTMVLLMMLTYMVAVFVTELVVESTDSNGNQDTQLSYWFGTLGDSVHSLYQAIAGGTDWGDMSSSLMTHVSPWCGVLFGMYVAFAMLVLLNLVTGVFVDGAFRLTKSDKQAEIVRQIHKAFQSSDEDHLGAIKLDAFRTQLETPDMKSVFAAIEMSVKRAEDLFKILDEDGNEELTAEEFANGSLQLQGQAKSLDLALMSQQVARGFANIHRCFEVMLGPDLPAWEDCRNVTNIVDRDRRTTSMGEYSRSDRGGVSLISRSSSSRASSSGGGSSISRAEVDSPKSRQKQAFNMTSTTTNDELRRLASTSEEIQDVASGNDRGRSPGRREGPSATSATLSSGGSSPMKPPDLPGCPPLPTNSDEDDDNDFDEDEARRRFSKDRPIAGVPGRARAPIT